MSEDETQEGVYKGHEAHEASSFKDWFLGPLPEGG